MVTHSSSVAAPTRRGRTYDPREVVTAILCLAPALIIIGAFVVYPLIDTGLISLTSWNGFSPTRPFVGVANYQRLIHDGAFWNSMLVTVLYALGVCILSVVTGLSAAWFLNASFRGRAVYRTAFFLPVVTSSIAAAAVWRYLFDANGPVNSLFVAVGMKAPNWLGDPHLALVSLTLLTVWKQLGLNTVLYLTALQAIPHQIYEAAAIDRSSPMATMRHITAPLLRPMTFFVVVQALVTTFQSFDLVYQLTKGGPLGGTEVLGFLVYRTAFITGKFGYGATVAYAGFAIVFVFTWLNWKLGGQE